MKNVLIFLPAILIFLGCKDNHNSQDSLYQFKHPTDTTFKKEIPTTGYSYKSDKYKEKQLGLENIESGFETFPTRIYSDIK